MPEKHNFSYQGLKYGLGDKIIHVAEGILLPAVSSIRIDLDCLPVVELIISTEGDHVTSSAFVAMRKMDEKELADFTDSIDHIKKEIGLKGRLTFIDHMGGLDYIFYGDDPDIFVKSQQLTRIKRMKSWFLLNRIAKNTLKYIGIEANTFRKI